MKIKFLLLFLSVCCRVFAQQPANEILLDMKRLGVVGSALYVAAHPDDENTAMLAWLAKDKLVKTGYLSITRGDGGQNLIGPEQAEYMGLIRTYELLAARKLDGAEQFFTRANDFGFSKTTEETMQIWGKEAVLGDVVWRIRKFKPDVLLCRFPPDSRAGHGNHSASAVLAEEAFVQAADPTKFPEQLKFVEIHQPKRIVWNTFSFGATSGQKPTEGSFISVEIGGYSPLLGKSYTEIAAESRSQHKSQGFGVAKNRGVRIEFLVHKAGEKATNDLFDGIELTWKRVPGGEVVQGLIENLVKNFKPEFPSASVAGLIEIYKKIDALPANPWKEQKINEVKNLIFASAGLFFEATTSEYAVSAGDRSKVVATAVKRSDVPVVLQSVRLTTIARDSTLGFSLGNNELQRTEFSVTIPKDIEITQPYWLTQPKMSRGMYTVNDNSLNGVPEKKPQLQAEFLFRFYDLFLSESVPLVHRYIDEVRGELYRPFEVRPEISIIPQNKVMIFNGLQPKILETTLKANRVGVSGSVVPELPKGWVASPVSQDFSFQTKFQENTFRFTLTPTTKAEDGPIRFVATTSQSKSNRSLLSIGYEHIPPLSLFPIAETKLVKLDVQTKAKQVGYIAGAGDDVPAALRAMGCVVTMLTEKELSEDLSKFQTIVVGVRAYNTEERLKFHQPKLMEFVKNGGTMVVQYQVNSGLQKLGEGIGPFPFKISRERVTVEEAEVRFLQPNHPVLNSPNKISLTDFDGWVQERGLYFSNEWDSQYTPILSSNDPNETEKNGGLLVAKYGKGTYVFTGYAFFRQLPAGVSGAYRLFANLISAGK